MRKILVVDDETEIRRIVLAILQEKGFEIISADNGATALDLAKTHRPDLIISDVMMDNGNGFMLQALLLEDPKTAAIPLILMTGQAQRAGAWESDPEVKYLEKPFSANELLSAVEKQINS